MQVLVGLNNRNISNYLNYTNSFIIGLKDFSINYLELEIDEIKKIKEDYPNIDLFVSINANIFNKDLKILENNLCELDKLNISGIFFYDISILSLKEKLNLKTPLVWSQEHMTTNYNTCNYFYDKGCRYVYLSSEITESEIKEIKEKSKIKIISFFFGYPEVSFSKRNLLTNYFLYHHKNKEKEVYEIKTDDDTYLIKENKLGTRITHGKILNGIIPFKNLSDDVSFGILNEDNIDHESFLKVLEIFKDVLENKKDIQKAQEEITNLFPNSDDGFFYKKTIYKVKE